MAAHDKAFERGSEWRKRDLHIPTPASFHWKGAKFDADPGSAANRTLVDEMIAALNAAEPAVFALMDYWTFDGWLVLERRLAAPVNCRLNAHVLFSNEVDDQTLIDFKSVLSVEIVNRPLSDAALIALARQVGGAMRTTFGCRTR